MPHIQLIEIADAHGLVREVYDDIERVRGEGRVSNLLKGYAVHPELLKVNWERMKVLVSGGVLPRRLKEAVMVGLAEINNCSY
jgi:hypothetical protein